MTRTHPHDRRRVVLPTKLWVQGVDLSSCQILTPPEATALSRLGLPVLGRVPEGVWIVLDPGSPSVTPEGETTIGGQWLYSTYPEVQGEE